MQIIAERSAAVGVLYIVYAQHGTKNPKASGLSKYLKEAAHSSLTLLRLNPLLPVALSTTESEALEQWVRNAFTLVVKLSAAKKHEPLWVPRLRALAESPFSLTLAMDSHATACSPELHTALLQEHHRAAYDLAVNFEAQACLRNAPKRSRNGIGRVYASTHASEMLPHNWAMVINKGAGLTSLFRVWRHALERMHARRLQPDDQWALTMTLRQLRNTGGCADHLPSPPGLLRRHLNASEPCLQRIRIRHLLDSAAAGFKSADKSRCAPLAPCILDSQQGWRLAAHVSVVAVPSDRCTLTFCWLTPVWLFSPFTCHFTRPAV